MKNKYRVLLALIFLGVFALLTWPVAAAESEPVAAAAVDAVASPVPPDAGAAIDGVFKALDGKAGWIVQLLSIMAFCRLIFKPLFIFLHAIVDATPTLRDNEWLAKIEASKAYQWIAWGLDYLFSVKLKREQSAS